MKILIVEDDAIIRMFLKLILKRKGYEQILEADSGESAIEIVEQYRPEVILQDMKLKGQLTGIETVEQIRKINDYEPICVFMSAYDKHSFDEKAMDSLFDHFLSKPVSAQDLHTLCATVCNR